MTSKQHAQASYGVKLSISPIAVNLEVLDVQFRRSGDRDALPGLLDLRSGVGAGAAVVDQHTGASADRRAIGDGRYPGAGVVRVHAVADDEPFELDRRIALDQPDLVAVVGHTALDELDSVDRDEGMRAPCDSRDRSFNHSRMGYAVELGQRDRVSEHDRAQCTAVDAAAGGRDIGPEMIDQRLRERLAGLDQFVIDVVRIDRLGAKLAEHLEHGRFAAGDIAGDTDHKWSG